MKSNVRLFDYKISEIDREKFHLLIDQVLDEGYLTNHTLVKAAETKFATFSKSKYNIAVNSGTSALQAALLALPKNKRKKIILPSNTFIACWLSVVQTGFEPSILDIREDYLGFNLDELEVALKKEDVFAVMVVHIAGIVDPYIHAIKNLCKQYGVYLIEDAAHAHSSTSVENVAAGSIGDIATFSFHLTKVMTCGEGGIVATNDQNLCEQLKSIRQYGKSPEDPHMFTQAGFNLKMSELHTALLLVEMDRADQRINRRIEINQFYKNNLKNLPISFLDEKVFSRSSCYKSVIVLEQDCRSELIEYLAKYNISIPNGVYYHPLHRQPVVKEVNIFPIADKFSDHHMCLPCYPELTNEQLEYFVEKLRSYYA